jgi:hypothetical protein
MNPNLRTPGTLLEPSAQGMLAEEQEHNEKKYLVHTPSIHGGAFIGSWCTQARSQLTMSSTHFTLHTIWGFTSWGGGFVRFPEILDGAQATSVVLIWGPNQHLQTWLWENRGSKYSLFLWILQCGWSVCMCETRWLVSPFIKFCMSLFVGLGFVGQTHPNEFFAPLSGLKDPPHCCGSPLLLK